MIKNHGTAPGAGDRADVPCCLIHRVIIDSGSGLIHVNNKANDNNKTNNNSNEKITDNRILCICNIKHNNGK